MKLKQKLLLGFLTITTLLIIISGIKYVQLNAVNDKYTSAIAEGTNKIQLTSYTLFESYQQEIELQSYLTTGNSESLDAFTLNQEEFQKNVANLASHTNYEEGLELTNQIISAEAEYAEMAEEAISYKQAGNTKAYTTLMGMGGRGSDISAQRQSIGKELLFYHQDAFTKVSDDLTNQTKTTTIIMIISLLALAVGIVITLHLSRTISSRVNQVADEVRKLAEQSRESANQIAELIQHIQTDTTKAVEMMQHGNDEITQGMSIAEETGKAFELIVHSIESTNIQTQELSATSEQISASVQQVNAAIEEVAELAKDSSTKSGEIAAATEEQLAAAEEVTSSATFLAQLAEELTGLVSAFRI